VKESGLWQQSGVGPPQSLAPRGYEHQL